MWFCSDLHFFHSKLLEYDKKYNSFEDAHEMNEAIVNNHNAVVKDDDIVYNLGDISLGKAQAQATADLLARMKGKLVLIKGNHESVVMKSAICHDKFVGIFDYLEIRVSDDSASRSIQHINLFHYAIDGWNMMRYGAWMLHGHSHGNDHYDKRRKIMNVGIMLNNYMPFSYESISKRMKDKLSASHH